MDANKFIKQNKIKTKSSNVDQMIAVQAIIDKVKVDGDQALYSLTKEFDQQDLDDLRVDPALLKASWDALEPDLQQALKLTKQRIEDYETKILYKDHQDDELSYVYRPLERVGIYVPGGTALYPSSVLMTIVPALVAGVKDIIVTTPVFQPNNITFAALYLCGVTDYVFTVGGAQAIAALAYGTESIPKVDKICGPGNAYVAMAKRQVFGDVGIDSIAGPSEILLYVDESTPVDAVVYDLFSQAEHDANARTFLLSESQEYVDRIEERMEELVESQVREDIIKATLANNHFAIVDSRDKLLEVIDYIGAEHVSIQHKDQDSIVDAINYAGAVFKGFYSMEAIGDYVAGPSHVLPTNRNARFSHGLNANDFRTSHAIISINEATYNQIAPAAEKIAQSEGLFAHQRSVSIRRESL
ncbi:histidinol dehydrogenase [Ruoffia sp. FAM 24228]|uniref:histidinol dehydrogenase n=1 Tax=unclassified Ruoffia TaxID=2862149 RepID=UPI0026AD33AB